jgi:outer membrane protein
MRNKGLNDVKKCWVFIATLLLSANSSATDLMKIYRQALQTDNVYQQALLQALADNEDVAINKSYLLPNAAFDAQPLVAQQANYGAIVPEIEPLNNTYHNYEMRLSLTQPIFNFAYFSRYKASKITARAAFARLNSDLQDLMIRVSEAYFNVLRSEKKLSYLQANRKALSRQLYDVQQKYKTGKTTKSYIDVVQSSYSAAESDLVAAETQLASDRESLIEITAEEYPALDDVKSKIPLVSPNPANAERWVQKATQGNWTIKANQLKMQSARERIKQAYADHLPTVNAKLFYDDDSFHYTQSSLIIAAGSSRLRSAAAVLNVNVPLFSGGLVLASTRKAQYNFRIAQQKLDQSLRQVTYHVRSNYRNVVANIKKIGFQADAIKAAQSSLDGLKQRYINGSGNLTDILNQQSQLLEAQMNYDSARYDYILSLLRLKKEAGTLSTQDLLAVNHWLHHA